jgi:hypothetical protein
MSSHAQPIGGFPVTGDLVAAPPARQAYHLLHFAFVVAPILAGLDKFSRLLVNWDQYLAPWVTRIVAGPAHTIMMVVGVMEIIAGLIVAFAPKVGSWLVCLWLWAIIINLVTLPGYFDIALRDFGLSLGALALARLSKDFA